MNASMKVKGVWAGKRVAEGGRVVSISAGLKWIDKGQRRCYSRCCEQDCHDDRDEELHDGLSLEIEK